jgi:hypothetical protein
MSCAGRVRRPGGGWASGARRHVRTGTLVDHLGSGLRDPTEADTGSSVRDALVAVAVPRASASPWTRPEAAQVTVRPSLADLARTSVRSRMATIGRAI